MHRVFHRVVAEPVKPVVLERVDPRRRQGSAVEDRALSAAERVFAPITDAPTAGVATRIDIDRNAVDVIRDLAAVIGIVKPQPADAAYFIIFVLTTLAKCLFDALECGHDLLVHDDGVPKKRRLSRIVTGRVGIHRGLSETAEITVLLGAIRYGVLKRFAAFHNFVT